MKKHKISELYQYCVENDTPLLPPTQYDPDNAQWFDFWSLTYDTTEDDIYKTYDLEFNRRFNDFEYLDLFDKETTSEVVAQFWYDVMGVLQINQKKYQEMYRIFMATDQQMPFDYNYDMTETTGAQKNTFTKGSQSDTIGSRSDTIGQITDSHNVAPFNSSTATIAESQDITSSHTDTIGSHTDTEGQRVDTSENDAWTLTRKGNIGVQTAGDIARIFTQYWTKDFKFMDMIFNDICKELLFVGD